MKLISVVALFVFSLSLKAQIIEPIPNQYHVNIGGDYISDVVSIEGLESTVVFSPSRGGSTIPSTIKYGDLVITKHVNLNSNSRDHLKRWWKEIESRQYRSRDIMISRLNQEYEPICSWKFKNAMIKSIKYTLGNYPMLIATIKHDRMTMDCF